MLRHDAFGMKLHAVQLIHSVLNGHYLTIFSFSGDNELSDYEREVRKKPRRNYTYDYESDSSDDDSKRKKRRRRRNKNKDTQNQRNIVSSPKGGSPTTSAVKSKCNACETTFPSKNKLYDHLRQFPKHALKSQH